MGTNFYIWNKEEPPTEETIDGAMHIGKCSAGWVFHFQSYPTARSLEEMKEWTKRGRIYDEYLDLYSYEDFWKMVEETKLSFEGQKPYILRDLSYPDENIFDSYEESGFAWTPVEFC